MLRKTTSTAAAESFVLHRQATVIDTHGMATGQFVTMAHTRDDLPAPTRQLAEAFAEGAALLGIEPMSGRGLGPLRRSARRASRLAMAIAALTAIGAVVSAVEIVYMLAQH